MMRLIPYLLAGAIVTVSSVTQAEEAPLADSQASTDTAANTFTYPSDETRKAMEAAQEEAFNRYIETLKNYPPAKQLPEDIQQRRVQMIEQLQTQHNMMMKMRKQRQAEFEQRRNQQLQKMHRI